MKKSFDKKDQLRLIRGSCEKVLPYIPENFIDAIVTDPPAGISFMGKTWDSDKGGKKQWIKWLTGIMKEALRILKPGGHILVWALPKTSHWTATAIENAGFEIRDRISNFYSPDQHAYEFLSSLTEKQINLFLKALPSNSYLYHLFGSGFPKNLDVSKAIDKYLGYELDVVGTMKTNVDMRCNNLCGNAKTGEVAITKATSKQAKKWDGWGTALKPACEFWILARKPLEFTVAKNVLKYKTGAINIRESSIVWRSNDRQDYGIDGDEPSATGVTTNCYGVYKRVQYTPDPNGRYPANVILTHHAECEYLVSKKKCSKPVSMTKSHKHNLGDTSKNVGSDKLTIKSRKLADKDGLDIIEQWQCHPNCPIRLLDEQSGIRPGYSGGGATEENCKYKTGNEAVPSFNRKSSAQFLKNDIGGASRFFKLIEPDVPFIYKSKPATSEKTHNNTVENKHPTVKGVNLMYYLIRLITPHKGIVLDMFMGSGSTGVAAIEGGWKFIGIEKDADYFKIAATRIRKILKKNFGSTRLFS